MLAWSGFALALVGFNLLWGSGDSEALVAGRTAAVAGGILLLAGSVMAAFGLKATGSARVAAWLTIAVDGILVAYIVLVLLGQMFWPGT